MQVQFKKERISAKAVHNIVTTRRAKASALSEATMKMSCWDSTKTASLLAMKLQEELPSVENLFEGGLAANSQAIVHTTDTAANWKDGRVC